LPGSPKEERAMSTRITGAMEITSWDEKPYDEYDGGQKLSQARVTQTVVGELAGEVTSQALLHYAADGTSAFVGLRRFEGTLDGRSGSFVLQEEGTYDGKTAKVDGFVIPGSGTDRLRGLTGTFFSASTHADYPNMPFTFEYDLA
jgi:uncharacterized protein DUF3224